MKRNTVFKAVTVAALLFAMLCGINAARVSAVDVQIDAPKIISVTPLPPGSAAPRYGKNKGAKRAVKTNIF